ILMIALCSAWTASASAEQTTVTTNSAAVPLSQFGFSAAKSAGENKQVLQEAIDWASPRGAALLVEPSDEPYPVDGGLILKDNVSLIGVHGPVGRGTSHASKKQPVGSVLRIQ